MEISERMKSRREELGLTIREVSRRTGLAPSTILRYENGDISRLGTDRVEALARALHCTEAYLMGWEDEYFMDAHAADVARAIFEDERLGRLFQAAIGASPADLEIATDYLSRSKERDEALARLTGVKG